MALNRLSTEIIEVRIEGADSATRSLEEIESRLEAVERQMRDTDGATENAGGGFSDLQASITTAGAAMAGFQAAAALASSALSAIKAPINLASDFERQFAQVRTLNTAIGDDLKQGLLKLAAEVPQTAGDLTSATYQAISAGVAPTDVIDFMKAASQTAVAAGGTLTEAVEILTAGVNAFGKQGETAGSISNKLFATVKRGVTTIPELNAVFGRASAAASSYGVSVDEILGAIAQLTLQGLPTTEAVTRVNGVLKELSNESGTAGKQLKQMGVNVGITALQQKGLLGLLKEVNEATGGSAEAIGRLSNRQEALQGFLKLTGDNMSAYSSIVKGITNDTEAAGEATRIMAETTDGANKLFEAAAEGAMRDLGNEILPAFTDLLRSVTSQLGSAGAGGAIKAFGTALAGVVKIVQVFVDNVGKIGLALMAAFGFAYYKPFVASLARMRAAIVLFHTNFTSLAASAGTTAGLQYGRLFLAGARSLLLGPVGIGLGVLFGAMMLDSFTEAKEEAEKRARDIRKGKSSEDLAVFIEENKINMRAIEGRLKTGQREKLLNDILLQQRKAMSDGDTMRAESLKRIATFLNVMSGQQINFNDLFFENAGFAKDLLVVLNELPGAANNVNTSLKGTVTGASTIGEKVASVKSEMEKLTTAQDKDNEAKAKAVELTAQLEQKRDEEIAKFEEMTMKQERLTKGMREEVGAYADSTQEAAIGALDFFGFFDVAPDKYEEQVAAIENARLSLHQHTQEQAKAQEEEENRGKTMEKLRTRLGNLIGIQHQATEIENEYNKEVKKSTSALDEKIQKLTEATNREIAFFRSEGLLGPVKQLQELLKLRIAALRKEDAERQAAERKAESRRKQAQRRREAAQKRIAKMKEQYDLEELKRKKTLDSRSSKSQQAELTHEHNLALQKLNNNKRLNPVERLEQKHAMEVKFSQEILNLENERIENEFTNEKAIADRKHASRMAEIAAMKLDDKTKKKLHDAEIKRHDQIIGKLKEAKRQARTDASATHRRTSETREVRKTEETKTAQEAKRSTDESREQMIEGFKATAAPEGDALSNFDAETVREQAAMQKTVEFEQATNEQRKKMDDEFNKSRLRAREKLAKQLQRIEQRQLSSAMDATANAIGEIGSIAANLGRSDSFVGKIEAAQIIAKGVYHGFQGASDQADALTHFQQGNVAGGVAAQAAALAHFAQAAVAPVFARRAATRQNASAGGAASVPTPPRGPRTVSAQQNNERRDRQQGITFGDIVLADIPALLSRQGSQALGRQVAGSVARELNRQRALPGGARI